MRWIGAGLIGILIAIAISNVMDFIHQEVSGFPYPPGIGTTSILVAGLSVAAAIGGAAATMFSGRSWTYAGTVVAAFYLLKGCVVAFHVGNIASGAYLLADIVFPVAAAVGGGLLVTRLRKHGASVAGAGA